MQHKRPNCRKLVLLGLYPVGTGRLFPTASLSRLNLGLLFSIVLIFTPLCQAICRAQTTDAAGPQEQPAQLSELFRVEKVPVGGGAELITVFARLNGLQSETKERWVPQVSILRDTLGDINSENDRLRYVWPLTFTHPTVKQRLAASIPLFYARVGNKENLSQKPPPPAFDLAAPESEVWNKVFWAALQGVLLDSYGTPLRASTSSYRRNLSDYRKSHIIRALSVLTLYQAIKGESAFSAAEMTEIQARLMLTNKTFGGLVDDSNLQRYYQREITETKDERGHNWELLRQRAEAESLYFEPLQMPDGSATHAMIWVSKRDLEKNQGTRYNSRFLNIANPWSDKRLANWHGYVETRYFDSESHAVAQDTPGAVAVEMIPLALYGLDNPKIPMLLVDFRDGYNPKKRELSRRVLHDVTKNVLALSNFGNLPFFLGRTVFDFVTGRRGIDINQPSRLQTYSQLKLLLALTDSLEPDLRQEVNGRLERISLNPFENDLEAEANVAQAQYAALVAYARNPEGLAARVERDRRSEMVPLEHGRTAQVVFRMAHVLTFGRYVHREQLTDEMPDRLDIARRLDYHTRFLQRVARSSSQIDVDSDIEDVRRSLRFIADHGTGANGNAVSAAAKIFERTTDDETRRACLESLSRIGSPKARNQLLRLSQNIELDQAWRQIAEAYLRQTNQQQPTIVSAVGTSLKAGLPRR